MHLPKQQLGTSMSSALEKPALSCARSAILFCAVPSGLVGQSASGCCLVCAVMQNDVGMAAHAVLAQKLVIAFR